MGEYADMLLDGSHDEQTGEYIGEVVGYPRTRQPGYYNSIPRGSYSKGPHNDRWSGNKILPIYNTILQLTSVNPISKGLCRNKNGTISFLHRFYKHINVSKKRSDKFKNYKDIVTKHKKEFKLFIKNL